MGWQTGDSVTADFCTQTPATGAATNADSTPTGTLVINGTDNGATVTVTNKSTGSYKAVVTLPAVSSGDVLQLRITAVMSGVTGKAVIWGGQVEIRQTGDTYALANGASGFVAIKAKTDNLPASPAATGDAMALTSGERNSIADAHIARNIAGGSSTGRIVAHVYAAQRNKVAFDVPAAGQFTVYGTDDTTTLWTGTYVATVGANPVTSIDPA